ncbi:MAG: hypothetical protein KDG55_02565 [Rhodocyclaceae bacterium]|nr:hypothetical protein [Rhodocyclaceae bacterium]
MSRLAIALATLMIASGGAAAELLPEPAVVRQPRAFGYQLGDRLEQWVLLDLPGRPFQPAELPPPERSGAWFERQALVIERDDEGRRWLRIAYQLVNSPPRLRTVSLPGWTIAAADGSPGLQVPDWPVSAAPLSRETAFTESGLGALRPDRTPVPPSIAPLAAAQQRAFAALAGVLLAWAGWGLWRRQRDRRRLPFAHAADELRHLQPDDPAAWQALHRAFDRTAGCVVDSATLARLFERRPELTPLAAPIEAFYRASAERFFAGRTPSADVSPHALCRALRKRELATQT